MAVRRRIRDCFGGYQAARSRLGNEQDRPTPAFSKPIDDEPHDTDCRAARPLLRDYFHRPSGKGIDLGARGKPQQHEDGRNSGCPPSG
jgi:hypothetical protein